ncbi:hypothetical protein [Mucilaginibacter sp.]|jgi:hypothetical protein|uniref:hypothetical protein n=1 Tax=Mucilaginibacter sp. TaxID=1882438 RepID=UPI002C409690|nr:hypothetical protein [Mucilaginibacter sp.]HTI60502.1 hypothetical protein [Mucilaginibacter sp.]
MGLIDDILPKRRESILYNSSQQVRDDVDRKEKIEREEISIKLQVDLTKRVKDLESTLKKQREIDRQESAKERELDYFQRQEERRKDKWFTGILLVIGAILGGLVVKLLDIFFK